MSIKLNKSSKRRGSEIYFVLYLSALILLLPGKQEKKSSEAVEAITALFQQSFSLLPEKNSLLSKITTDANGSTILQLDTSNVLLLTGNVRDLSFECIVEDQNNEEIIQVASKEGEHFSIVYDSTKRLVFFSWHPPVSMLASLNKSISYIVTVKAKAKPFISAKNPELLQLLRGADAMLQTEAKFSISILTEGLGDAPPKIVYMPAETTFTRLIVQPQQIPQMQTPSISESNGQNNGIPLIEQDFSLSPKDSKIDVIAYQQWTNRIFSQGIYFSSNYAGTPTLKIEHGNNDNTGSAEIVDVNNGDILIKGTAPASAAMKVKVTAKRKTDNKVVTTDFIIDPRILKEPDIPKWMYPNYDYVFKPEMPSSPNLDARAVLRNSQRVLAVSSQGQPFMYRPEIEDTGTIVYFERIINGKIAGTSYSIRIHANPVPEILEQRKVGNSIMLEVRTYGRFNGRPNSSRIEYEKGNANNVYPAQDNRADYDAKNPQYTIQKFVIRPKDSDKKFNAVVYARDKYGKVSDPMIIQSE